MRRIALLLASVLVLVFAANLREAQADVTVGVDMFYNDLAPYGDWFEMQDYGWAWTPRNVSSDWRPYTRGQWVFSDDDGWLWASDEDFGWATYHYGRWFFDDRYGWVWVPGREWAPAWVAWRSGGGYVGWAPLPPQFRSNVGVGFRAGDADFDSWIGPRQYVFVPERQFVDSRVYRRALPPVRNVTIVNETRNVTNYGVRQNRLVNRSLSLQQIEQHVGHAVPRVRVVEERAAPPRRAEVQGGQVRVFRPTVRSDSAARPQQARASNDVPRVKPHPVEPPIDPKTARRPERPPTAAVRPSHGQTPSANLKPGPGGAEPRRVPQVDQRQRAELQLQQQQQRARESKEALQQQQERQQQALRDKQVRQEQQLKQKQQQQQEREARQREGQRQAQLQRQQAEQQQQERQKQAIRDTQARREQELEHKHRQEQQQVEARQREAQRQAQLQRQQDQQRLKLQQQQERDQQALRDKQARQQQEVEQKQRKQQARDDQAKQKQQQRAEGKKSRPNSQPTPPPS